MQKSKGAEADRGCSEIRTRIEFIWLAASQQDNESSTIRYRWVESLQYFKGANTKTGVTLQQEAAEAW